MQKVKISNICSYATIRLFDNDILVQIDILELKFKTQHGVVLKRQSRVLGCNTVIRNNLLRQVIDEQSIPVFLCAKIRPQRKQNH
jgi:hypothetical protein